MIVDLSRLIDGRLRQQYSLPGDDPELDALPGRVVEPIELDVEVVRVTEGTYVVTVDATGSMRTRCRRCLDPVEVSLDDRFRLVIQVSDEPEAESGDDDVVLIDRSTSEINLGDIVRERLLIESDLYPVCSESCAGICPECGQNRNEQPCDCSTAVVDDRWSALSGIQFDSD